MRIRLVTYRWGEELLGGAELHHRRLAAELRDLGHEVSVVTTTGRGIRTFCHWGVEWDQGPAVDSGDGGGTPISRTSIARRPRWLLAVAAKAFQRRFEREEQATPEPLLRQLAEPCNEGIYLLTGWHYPESSEGRTTRWTHGVSRFFIKAEELDGCGLHFGYYAPKPNRIRIESEGRVLADQPVAEGHGAVSVSLDGVKPGILTIHLGGIWRPVRDFRGLGVLAESLQVVDREKGAVRFDADLGADFRALGRLSPEAWQRFLLDRCRSRPRFYGNLIDLLRGPVAPGLDHAVAAPGADLVIHCNLPWANINLVRPGDLAMPLWHVEDEFYYWSHWIKALQRARFVLANTPYTADRFFPKLGIDAAFVGPPIWPPEKFPEPEAVRAFRAAHQIAGDDVLVLTVCRKSGEKRYEAIAEAVARGRAAGAKLRMIGVGPDADGKPFHFDGCQWVGRLDGDDLERAYAACDVFALMSESESFGMVIPEAWHHGKPVIVNRTCGPAASLLDEGEDGLLALPGAELDAALQRLAGDPGLRRQFGLAGREKARRLYVRGAAAQRLMDVLKERTEKA